MQIGGLQKTTLLDYPGRIACTVFLPGCNLRCPFCHNAGLVLPEQIQPALTEEELFSFLQRRRGKLDGVCVTGGEPTVHPELPEFLSRIRDLGFPVKLDTNGSNPRMLRQLLEAGILDYVAVDIKNAPSRYREICGGVDILPQVRQTVELLMDGKTCYEFRTTVSHPYHDEAAMTEIGQWLHGAKQYFIQAFIDSGHLVGRGAGEMTEDEIKALHQAVLAYIPSARIRGI